MLKSELQALASALPPSPPLSSSSSSLMSSHHDGSAAIVNTMNPNVMSRRGGLSLANLHRLREDLLRWREMQERRTMIATASSGTNSVPSPTSLSTGNSPGIVNNNRFDNGGSDAVTAAAAAAAAAAAGYYLLSPEIRQRLVNHVDASGHEVTRSYEAAALLQSGTWSFMASSGFPCLDSATAAAVNSSYLNHHQQLQPYLQPLPPSTRHHSAGIQNPHQPSLSSLENGFRENLRLDSLTSYEIMRYHESNKNMDEPPSPPSSDLCPPPLPPRPSLSNLYRSLLSPPNSSPGSPYSKTKSNYSLTIPNDEFSTSSVTSLDNNSCKTSTRSSPSSRQDSLISPIGTNTTSVSPNSSNNPSSHQVGKKTKKPFTIENIIAPDDDEIIQAASKMDVDLPTRKSSLLVPRPFYAGYALPVVKTSDIQRPPYGAAT